MTNILGNIANGLNGRATKLIAIIAGAVLVVMYLRRR